MNISSTTLYDYDFQLKIIVALLTDYQFLTSIIDILETDYFESSGCQWLIALIKDYFATYKSIITFSVIKKEYRDIENGVLKTAVREAVRDLKKYLNSRDLQYIKDETTKFCKNKNLKMAIMKSVKLLENEKYDDIRLVIDNALMAGTLANLGSSYIDDFEVRYNKANRKSIKTPWPVINELSDGGLGKGEFGLIVGPQGSGKSWLLSGLGAQAVKNNKKVVHYTFELSEEYVGLRYDSFITGIPFQKLKYNKEDVKKRIAQYKDKLKIKFFPENTIHTGNLVSHIQQLEMRGFKPDLIIVDYADCMLVYNKEKLFGSQGTYSYYGVVYQELRGLLAGELQVPVWSASQGNRKAYEAEVTEGQHVADSMKKIGTPDFIMGFSRKKEDKVTNTARVLIIKNRFGPDGIVYNCKFNADIGRLKIYDEDTKGSFEQGQKMANQDVITRKLIRNKLKNLGGDENDG